MKPIKYLLLVLLSLACSFTTPPADRADTNFVQAGPAAQIADETNIPTPTPITCMVTSTVLQLREYAGVNCTVKD
jgi:hypothetical protein